MATRIVEALPGMEIGKGFDAETFDTKVSDAVVGRVGRPQGATGQTGEYRFEIVKGSEEFREALEVGASVSAGAGLFGASAKAKYADSCKVSSESTVCILSFEATNAFETFTGTPRLADDAEELLRTGKPDRFRERFGNRFVSGRFTGGHFYGTIRIEAETTARESELALKIQASYGPFKASGKVDKTTSQELSKERIEILTYQSGGRVEPVNSMEELFERAKKVSRDISKGGGVPILVTLEDYDELELPTDDLSQIEHKHAKTTLNALAKHYEAMKDRINDIDYVLRNADYFVKFNATKLSNASKKLAAELEKIMDHATVCSRDFSECKLYQPIIPQYELPERKVTRKTLKARKERLLRRAAELERHARQLGELLRTVTSLRRKSRLTQEIQDLRARADRVRARATPKKA